MCVLPLQTVCCCYDKKNRLLEHNTYLRYLPLSDSDKIYRDSLSIHRLVSRKNDYSGRQNKNQSPSEQISSLSENLLGLDYHSIQSNSASTVAALLNDIFTLVVVVVVIVITQKAEPNRTEEYIDLQGRSSLFFTINTCLSRTNTKSIQEEKKEEDEKKQQHQNHDPPPHGFHPIINNLLLLLFLHYQTFPNHHQKIPSKSLSRRNGNHSL